MTVICTRRGVPVFAIITLLSAMGSSHAANDPCSVPLNRQLLVAPVSQLLATTLYNITLKTMLMCQSHCLAINLCSYMTFSHSNQTCTLYAPGFTAINITGLQAYAVDFKNVVYSDPSCYPCASNPCQQQGLCTDVFAPDPQCICTGSGSFAGAQCQNLKLAFYIGASATTIAANTSNILFDNVITSAGNSTYDFTTKAVYWFQLAAGVPAKSPTTTRLNGLPYPLVIATTNTAYSDDVIATDTIQTVTINTMLSVSNEHALLGTTNNFISTSLLGFRLDTIMDTQIYFAGQATQPFAVNELIVFDRVLINVGNALNAAGNSLTIPITGNYFVSISIGAQGSAMGVVVKVNGNHTADVCACDYGAGSNNDITTLRGAMMLPLTQNDVVNFTTGWSGLYSTANGLINAQAFLYSPLGGSVDAVAWSVALALDFHTGIAVGPTSFVAFNVVLLNLQNVWDAATNKVTIPAAGTYFIDHTFYMCGSQWCGNGNPMSQVIFNAQPVITISLSNYTAFNCISRSRSVILNLNVGDQLYVNIPTPGCYYSVFGREICFTGFRLF